ncbi:PAS domain-containing protein, partial [Methanospirillum hungatei]|uniref:PAS domain-containing sensor histidine kinase n=1 Tax=Methanospirillum hungatei TaxID=2203 RepID=UPI0026F2397A
MLADPNVLYNQIVDDDRPGLIEAEDEAFRKRTSFSHEIRIRTPDGQIRWILLRSIPHVLPDESILWDGIEIDITDQKRAEEELRMIHELFHQFMLHSPIYIFIKEVTQDTSRVLYASENYQDMIGIPGSRIAGHTMYELFPPDFAEKMTADDWKVVSEGVVLTLRESLNDKHYITIKFPIIEKNRRLLAGYTIDITELHKTQKALHEANQKVRLLTGLTRHDIFNELSVIMGYHDLIAETEDLAEISEYVSKARKTCEQIIATISFTREYEDFGTAESRWQNLRKIIESAQEEVNADGITIINDIPEDCEIYADPVIRKVFTTLLENAIRHGETITKIHCFCTKDENQLIITCQDDGVGVPDDEKRYIFGL